MSERSFYRITELIIAMGGVKAVRQRLDAEGFGSLPLETVQGWKRRNSCPGHYALALVEIAMRDGLVAGINRLRIA